MSELQKKRIEGMNEKQYLIMVNAPFPVTEETRILEMKKYHEWQIKINPHLDIFLGHKLFKAPQRKDKLPTKEQLAWRYSSHQQQQLPETMKKYLESAEEQPSTQKSARSQASSLRVRVV